MIRSTKKYKRSVTLSNTQMLFRLLAFTVVCGVFTLYGCKSKKNLGYERPEGQTDKFLGQKLAENDFEFETLSYRLAVDTELKEDKKSFKVSMRMRKDSAIWSTITFLGRPVIITLITPDTVKYIDKIRKEYFIGDVDYLNRVMGSEITFDMLQDLLVGDAIGADSLDANSDRQKYDTSIDSVFYLAASHSKRKIRKALEEGADSEIDYIYRYWLDPVSYQMNRQMVNKLSDTTSIEVGYSEYLEVGEQLFPGKEVITITSPRDTGYIEMEVSKVKYNEEVTFPFRVGSKYTRIK